MYAGHAPGYAPPPHPWGPYGGGAQPGAGGHPPDTLPGRGFGAPDRWGKCGPTGTPYDYPPYGTVTGTLKRKTPEPDATPKPDDDAGPDE